VECAYCRTDVLLGGAKKAARVAAPLPPKRPSLLWARIVRYAPLVQVPLLAWLTPLALMMVFWRPAGTDPELVTAVLGAVLLSAVITGRRLFPGAVALGVGLLLAVKPWLRPMGHSPTSETGLFYVVPGAILALFGVLVLSSLSAERVERELKPGWVALVSLIPAALVLAFSVQRYSGDTVKETLARFRRPLDTVRAELVQLEKSLPDARPVPGGVLSPQPVLAGGGVPGDTEIVAFPQLLEPSSTGRWALYLHDALLRFLQWSEPGGLLYSTRLAEPDLKRQIDRALKIRYLGIYRDEPVPAGSAGDEDARRLTIWLVDRETGDVLFRTPEPVACSGFTGCRESVLGTLAAATGGTFPAD